MDGFRQGGGADSDGHQAVEPQRVPPVRESSQWSGLPTARGIC